MKFKLAAAFAALVVAAAMTFQTASAQSPSQSFGIGVNTYGSAELCYAISPAIHIGTTLGIDLHSSNGNSSNSIIFGPYGRFILKGTKEFKPYLFGQFGIASGGGTTSTGLNLGAGGFYFPTSTVALFGQVSVVSVGFDPSVTDIGVHSAGAGILWFFN